MFNAQFEEKKRQVMNIHKFDQLKNFERAQPPSNDCMAVFLNPSSIILDCQKTNLKFYNECQAYFDPQFFPNIEPLRKLVTSQYYPPIKRYNELSQLIRQLPEIDKSIDLDVPPPTFYFDKPQSELIEMITYLNQQLNRIF